MSRDVHIDGVADVSDDACYRAMDWLHAVRGELEKQVYFAVAGLLDLEVDLLFFDYPALAYSVNRSDHNISWMVRWCSTRYCGRGGQLRSSEYPRSG